MDTLKEEPLKEELPIKGDPLTRTERTLAQVVGKWCKDKDHPCTIVKVEWLDEESVTMIPLESKEGRHDKESRMFEKIEGVFTELPPFQVVWGNPTITVEQIRRVFFRCFTRKSIMEEYKKQDEEVPHFVYGITGPLDQITDIKL